MVTVCWHWNWCIENGTIEMEFYQNVSIALKIVFSIRAEYLILSIGILIDNTDSHKERVYMKRGHINRERKLRL